MMNGGQMNELTPSSFLPLRSSSLSVFCLSVFCLSFCLSVFCLSAFSAAAAAARPELMDVDWQDMFRYASKINVSSVTRYGITDMASQTFAGRRVGDAHAWQTSSLSSCTNPFLTMLMTLVMRMLITLMTITYISFDDDTDLWCAWKCGTEFWLHHHLRFLHILSSCGCSAHFSKVPWKRTFDSVYHIEVNMFSCLPYNCLIAANGEKEGDEKEGEKLVEGDRPTHPRVFHGAVLRALQFTFLSSEWCKTNLAFQLF